MAILLQTRYVSSSKSVKMGRKMLAYCLVLTNKILGA